MAFKSLPPFVTPPRRMTLRAARAWTSSLDATEPVEIVIAHGVIESVAWGSSTGTSTPDPPRAGDLRVTVDASAVLMPGLVDCHAHPSFPGTFDFDTSAFADAATTARHARTMLRAGFTSIVSAASAKPGVELAVRRLVHSGALPGPRWRTAGPEFTPPHGLGAGRVASAWESDCFGRVCATRAELLAGVRECAALGLEAVKINVSGEETLFDAAGEATDVASTFDVGDVRAVVDAAHAAGLRVAAHARGCASVRDALSAGVDVIYHCDFAGAAGVEALARASNVLLGPSLGFLARVVASGDSPSSTFAADAKLRASLATHRALLAHREGCGSIVARLGIGGDWCFPQTPHGGAAFDLELYVRELGMAPCDALRCATSSGGAFMGDARAAAGDAPPHEPRVGVLAAGAAGDVIVALGDPTADVAVLQRPLALVVSAGRVALRGGGGGCAVAVEAWDGAASQWVPWAAACGGDSELESASDEALQEELRRDYAAAFPAATPADVELALATPLSDPARGGGHGGGV